MLKRTLQSSEQLTTRFFEELDELLPSFSSSDQQTTKEWAERFKDWDYLLELKEVEQQARPRPDSDDLQRAKELLEKKISGIVNVNQALAKIKEERENSQLRELAIQIEAANQKCSVSQALSQVKFIDKLHRFIGIISNNIKQKRKLKIEQEGKAANKSQADITEKVKMALQEMVSTDDIVAEVDQSIDESYSYDKLVALYKRLSLFKKILDDARKGEWNQKNLNFIDQVHVAIGQRVIAAIPTRVERDVNQEIESVSELRSWIRVKTDAEIKLFISKEEERIDKRTDLDAKRKEQMKKRVASTEEDKKIDAEVVGLKDVWKQVLLENKIAQDSQDADKKISDFISQKRRESKEGLSQKEIADVLHAKLKQEFFKDKEKELNSRLALNEKKRYIELRAKREMDEFYEKGEKEAQLSYDKLKKKMEKTPYSKGVDQLQTVRVKSEKVENRYSKLVNPNTLTNLQDTCASDRNRYAEKILGLVSADARVRGFYSSERKGVMPQQVGTFLMDFEKEPELRKVVKRNYSLMLAIDKYKAQEDMYNAVREQDQVSKQFKTKAQRYADLQKQLVKHKVTLTLHRDESSLSMKRVLAIFGVALFTLGIGFASKTVRTKLFDPHGADTVRKFEETLPLSKRKLTQRERVRALLKDAKRRGLR